MMHSPALGPGGIPAAGGPHRAGPTPMLSPALGPLAAVEQLQRGVPPQPGSSPGSARPGQPLVRPKSVLQETMREVCVLLPPQPLFSGTAFSCAWRGSPPQLAISRLAGSLQPLQDEQLSFFVAYHALNVCLRLQGPRPGLTLNHPAACFLLICTVVGATWPKRCCARRQMVKRGGVEEICSLLLLVAQEEEQKQGSAGAGLAEAEAGAAPAAGVLASGPMLVVAVVDPCPRLKGWGEGRAPVQTVHVHWREPQLGRPAAAQPLGTGKHKGQLCSPAGRGRGAEWCCVRLCEPAGGAQHQCQLSCCHRTSRCTLCHSFLLPQVLMWSGLLRPPVSADRVNAPYSPGFSLLVSLSLC